MSTTANSLWDRAYDTLKEDKEDRSRSERIAEYEDLLYRVLVKGLFFYSCLPCTAGSNGLFSIPSLDADRR
jgi:hypothetical protein